MTDRDALRDALAAFWLDSRNGGWHGCRLRDGQLDKGIAAVRAALDGPGDRSDPAVGLREAAQSLVDVIESSDGTTFGGRIRIGDATLRVKRTLAATPTASPTAPATAEHALLVSSGWEFTGYDRGSPTYRRTPTASPTATGEDSDA